jgi:PhnB protein
MFAQAVTAGKQIRQPLADMLWGDRHGQFEDPFAPQAAVAGCPTLTVGRVVLPMS